MAGDCQKSGRGGEGYSSRCVFGQYTVFELWVDKITAGAVLLLY